MLPKKHILYGLIFSIVISFLFNLTLLEVGLIFLASFLLDFDHYLYSVFREKTFSLKKAYLGFIKKGKKFRRLAKQERRNYVSGFYLFHGLETLVVLGLLGFFVSDYFYFILTGVAFHLILDYLHLLML